VGRGGRFGKYGEHKRFERLRTAKKAGFIPGTKSRSHPKTVHVSPSGIPKRFAGALKVAFRTADSRDLPFITRLSEQVFSPYGPYDEIVAHWASFPHITTVVVEEKSLSRGYAMINPMLEAGSFPKAELMAIAVLPEYQLRGIGKMLLRHMEELARRLGIGEMVIHTATMNRVAQGFFAKNGYIRRGLVDSYYPMGQEAMEMSKTLTMSL
jgi:ribosomal protein S18 acetylase RimI-like enzyme